MNIDSGLRYSQELAMRLVADPLTYGKSFPEMEFATHRASEFS